MAISHHRPLLERLSSSFSRPTFRMGTKERDLGPSMCIENPRICIPSRPLGQIMNLLTPTRRLNWLMLTHLPPLRRLLLKAIQPLPFPWRRIHTRPPIAIRGLLLTPFGDRKDGGFLLATSVSLSRHVSSKQGPEGYLAVFF